ncbi:tripartite tricarboxylate transporter TctB family protein [Ancylobacter sp. 6x-1]|uniref:Tripartite tricarboxylate transporter TctB family protein n=1 Tax=Ancylobacter crimeensis TaxID=2579147 RepID=A0ABT0DDU6_9HYPH|nr:tripartite tricarboxylate transporter TctB family protein [Ancylobacter crimeensis]MCK0198148.1 tripartite tricarboxylate transporter TctB family protein [Ancylobacter crimeensis]
MLARRRSIELGTAVAVAIFGGIVATESLGHDIGWGEAGPGAGYFPFRIGLLLIAVSTGIFIQSLRMDRSESFVSATELRASLAVFLPTAALVALMPWLGCYVPSFVYLAYMMRRHGDFSWLRSIALAAVVMAVFFLVFEIWFRVPLAKGPIESMLGIY